MPLHYGTAKVVKRYRGTQEIVAAYRDSQKVYSSESPMSGTSTKDFAAVNVSQLMAYFTIKTTGTYSITYGLGGQANHAAVRVNGVQKASYSYDDGPSTTVLVLNAGDKVEFTATRLYSAGPITVTYDCAQMTRYSYSESQDSTSIFIQVTAANTWQTLSGGTNPYSTLPTAGLARVEWTMTWGDQTYGMRFIVNGVETAYQQIQGGGGANVYQTLTIPEQAIPAGATWSIQVRTSDPNNNINRRIRRASIVLA